MSVSSRLALLATLFAPLSACGEIDEPPPAAHLTIEGVAWIAIPSQTTARLAVRYHDGDERPLAGRVDFAILGEPGGATLSASTAATADDGVATIDFHAPDVAESFQVRASAADAEPVEWTVTVMRGAPRVTGSYELTSALDVRGAAVGLEAVLLELTDDPHDPASYLLDRIGESTGGLGAEVLDALRPGLDVSLALALDAALPGGADRLRAIGDRLAQVVDELEVVSRLSIAETDGRLRGRHAPIGYRFAIDGEVTAVDAGELGVAMGVGEPLALELARDRLTIPAHAVPLPLAELLDLALERAVVPALDPDATDLGDLLSRAVGCDVLSAALEDEVGAGLAAASTALCHAALAAAAELALDRLRQIGGAAATELHLTGAATAVSRDGDRTADALEDGHWSGTIGSTLPLPSAGFVGIRLEARPSGD